MALLAVGETTDYIDLWCERLELSKKDYTLLDLYTAIHCATFMGEIGQAFNKEEAAVDYGKIEQYELIVDSLLGKL